MELVVLGEFGDREGWETFRRPWSTESPGENFNGIPALTKFYTIWEPVP